jgi:hypothetical protein
MAEPLPTEDQSTKTGFQSSKKGTEFMAALALAETALQPGDVGTVPAGGDEDQLLAKASNADHDFKWVDPPTGSGGGPAIAFAIIFGA